MKVVLDTNILISSILTKDGVCARILALVRAQEIEAVYSTAVMLEYLRVMSYPRLKLAAVDTDGILDLLEKEGFLTEVAPLPPLRDASDTKFLEAAVGGQASYLITGNLKDYPKSPHKGVKVVGPGEFLKQTLF